MGIQYVHDQDGKKTAVLIPIEEWEAMQERLTQIETMSAEEQKERAEAFAELEQGGALDLDKAMGEW